MEIRISGDAQVLVLSDEELDNDNYVELWVENGDSIGNKDTIPLDDFAVAVLAFRDKRLERLRKEKLVNRGIHEDNEKCPPHNLIDYDYTGSWGGSIPPPNKKCTKCLGEFHF